ncbi:uncharacterized protein LACBIDRAFT_316338 [Laccaria bicolor S238N-H82]|uniref:Predicted protein n=1 Tax=Laccaria bicolor (strain S238N-H82 / ATCC MYA-4686) TaxID=486041 RepID=B0E0R3_LACBS|nr:uncharacterized protein LACBIDRAFT_316338 [Laccaria bicolor S238N-H82]EDQ99573.1 predicted protein [Laccaria bicolor S238N-H82]|eukprot:XP_001889797.1 predicted protein [Laccaria bicolor S238N-H82]
MVQWVVTEEQCTFELLKGYLTSPTSPKPQVQTLLDLPIKIKVKHILTITLPRITSSPAFSLSKAQIVSPSTVEQGQSRLVDGSVHLVFPMTGRVDCQLRC